MDYKNICSFEELSNETIKFLFNLTKKKSKLKEQVILIKKRFDELKNTQLHPESSEQSEILDSISGDREIKSKKIKKSKEFRFRRKDVFLTYSDAQNDPDIKVIYKELLSLDKDSGRPDKIHNNIEQMFIVKEKHQNGVTHFHVYIKFFESLDRSDYTLFNVPSLKSPKIVYVSNNRKVIRYMAKHLKTEEDWINNSIQHNMDAKYYIETNAYLLSELCYKMISDKISPEEAVKESPILLQKYHILKNNLCEYKNYFELKNNPGKEITKIEIGHKDKNPLEFHFDKNKKKTENPQFWICGNTNSGKTYCTEKLEAQGHNGYIASIDEENWEDYSDSHTNFIEFEEYKGEKTIRFMNRLLEGTKMPLRVKGKSRILKKVNKPVFIKSNYLPHEAYSKADKNNINLLLQRIYVIYLDQNQKAHLIWNPQINKIEDYPWGLNCMDDTLMAKYLSDGIIPPEYFNHSMYVDPLEYFK